jgi:3-methylfumaryl-CoA hydratase
MKMSDMDDTGIDELRQWIGRSETSHDEITPRLAQELSATLDFGEDGTAPLMIHWCLAPAIVPISLIGTDGHPQRGGFLPPVPLPRRMWAGGKLSFHDRLRIGDMVKRQSTIADVTIKQGRSGILCFVTVDHALHTGRGLAIAERQDIVYRPMQTGTATTSAAASPRTWQWEKSMQVTPVTLFRYSTVTFNGHRIHYDRTYATETELYAGLVVHGPLQATWLMEFAATIKGTPPARFSFRGLQPLLDFMSFQLCARENSEGLDLWIRTEDGAVTMEAQATW